MLQKLKSIVYPIFDRACRLVEGTGIGNVPGVRAVYCFLFRHLWPEKSLIEVAGSKMYVGLEGLPECYRDTFRPYITSHNWEKLTTEMFKRVVKEGDVVLDIGANIGYFTLLAARLVGEKGRVYSFEPEPINHSLLLKNIRLNSYDNVVPVQKAVSNVKGTVRLHLSDTDTGAHTLRHNPSGDKFATTHSGKFIEVESVVLDEYFENKGHAINVVKMDVEGAEMAVLLGMDKILKQNQDLRIFAEFYPLAIKEFGYPPEEFIGKLMADHHFSIFAIDYLPWGTKEHLKIESVDQLVDLMKGKQVINLFLERE
jgi:FkbM family methyltransferase